MKKFEAIEKHFVWKGIQFVGVSNGEQNLGESYAKRSHASRLNAIRSCFRLSFRRSVSTIPARNEISRSIQGGGREADMKENETKNAPSLRVVSRKEETNVWR